MTVRVRVEKVLQGEVVPKEVNIFYFADLGGGSYSDPPVWTDLRAGQSEIFFLQGDNGKLRTICDGCRNCIIEVPTGTHYNFKAKEGLPIEDVIARLILSRGDHTTDSQLVKAIRHSWPVDRWGTLHFFNALKELSVAETSPEVQTVIAENLQNYTAKYGRLTTTKPCWQELIYQK